MTQSPRPTPVLIRHDSLTIALHWLTALLVVANFLLAETWDFLPRSISHVMVITHMSLGVSLAAVFALRLVWRLRPGHTRFNDGNSLASRAARLVHGLLYILIGVEILLGFLTRWTHNHPVSFFGLLIPSPFGTVAKPVGEFVGELHDITAWTIIILAGLHAAAALFHHYVLKDGVLRRMMPRHG